MRKIKEEPAESFCSGLTELNAVAALEQRVNLSPFQFPRILIVPDSEVSRAVLERAFCVEGQALS